MIDDVCNEYSYIDYVTCDRICTVNTIMSQLRSLSGHALAFKTDFLRVTLCKKKNGCSELTMLKVS